MKKLLLVLSLVAATAFCTPAKVTKTDTVKGAKTTKVVKKKAVKKAVKAKKASRKRGEGAFLTGAFSSMRGKSRAARLNTAKKPNSMPRNQYWAC